MPVYVGTTYTAAVSGSTAVAVRCEKCGNKYYYQLTRTAVGHGTAHYGLGAEEAKKKAHQHAKRALRRRLDDEIDPVPCPQCGWYQTNMLPLLRPGRLRWLVNVAGGCLAGGILIFAGLMVYMWAAHEKNVPDPPDWVPWLLAGFAGFVLLGAPVLFATRLVLNHRYDANKAISERERILRGQERALVREVAQELMKQQDD